MPYNPKSGQATAAFLNIKRRNGVAAAKAFGRRHSEALSAAAKAQPKTPGYRSRKERNG